MKNKPLIASAVGIILLSNAYLLAKTAYNRANIVQSIQLSENELTLSYRRGLVDGRSAYLEWDTLNQKNGMRNLQSDAKTISNLGFSSHCKPYREYASAFVLLELSEEYAQKKREQRKETSIDQRKQTRLFITAASYNKALLQPQNPSNPTLILNAKVSALCEHNMLYISQILPSDLTLPYVFPTGNNPKKYHVTLHLGQLADVWLSDFTVQP